MSRSARAGGAVEVVRVRGGAGESAPRGEEQGTGRVLLKQVMGFMPGALLPAAVTLGSTVIFTRIFGSDEFGRYTLAVSVATLLTTLAIQWVQQGTGRWLPGAHASGEGTRLKESIGAIMLGAGALLALLSAAGIVLLGDRLPPVWRPMLWPGAALVVGVAMFEPLLVVFQSEMRARRYSAFKALDVSLRLALGLALVLFAARAPQSLLWGNALAPLLLFPLLWRDARMPPLRAVLARFASVGPDLRRIAGYGVPLVGWFVASYTLSVSDRYIIQIFRGAGEVGIYSANYSLAAGAGGLMTAPVLLAVHPLLMRAWDAGRPEVAQRWLGVIVEWFIVAGVLVVGVLALFSADVARLLLGPEFREGHVVLPIAMAGAVAWQLGLYAQKPLEFAGRVRTVLAISVAAAACNVAINLVTVPRFGYVAAAYATLVAYAVYAVLAALAGRGVLRWSMRWKELAGTLALSGAGLGLAWAGRALVAPSAGEGAGLLAALALVVPTVALVARRMVKPLLGKG